MNSVVYGIFQGDDFEADDLIGDLFWKKEDAIEEAKIIVNEEQSTILKMRELDKDDDESQYLNDWKEIQPNNWRHDGTFSFVEVRELKIK